MNSKTPLKILRTLSAIGYYTLIIITVIFLILSVLNIAGFKNIPRTKSYEVISFGTGSSGATFPDPNAKAYYTEIKDHFRYSIKLNSRAGYYDIIITLVYMSLGILALYYFRKILKDLSSNNPFHNKIVRYLKVLALLFIASECVKFIDYLITKQIMKIQFPSMHFSPSVDIGSGVITGLIILVIAYIYQRGCELQSENELTV